MEKKEEQKQSKKKSNPKKINSKKKSNLTSQIMKDIIKQTVQKSCEYCHKDLDISKEHYVLLGTYNRSVSPDAEHYYHFLCWAEFFHNCVDNKSKRDVEFMQSEALKILENPMIKDVLGQIKGSDNVLSMLKIPLSEQVISVDNLVKKQENKKEDKKKENGRTNRNSDRSVAKRIRKD